MKFINMIFILFFMTTPILFAEEHPSPEKIMAEHEKMKQEMEEMQKKDLEMLKKIDPRAYKMRLKSINKQKNINEVISLYNKKEISEASARSQLLHFAKQETVEQLKSIDFQINRLEKQVNYLKDIKNNPDKYTEKKIDRYLGKDQPNPEEMDFF